jgi:hypothetical protein
VSLMTDQTETVLSEFDFTKSEAQSIHAQGNILAASLRDTLRRVFAQLSGRAEGSILWQQHFYRDFFGLEIDLFHVPIPVQRPGFDRLLIMAPSLTINQLRDACVKQFPCFCFVQDLNQAFPHQGRIADADPYAVWVRDRREADVEFSGWSANKVILRNIPGITLSERLLFELQYFAATGQHLDDQKSVTLCSGSLDKLNCLPSVNWNRGELVIKCFGSSISHPDLRCRQVIFN